MERYIDYVSRTDFTSTDSGERRESDYLYSKDSNDRLHLTKIPGILHLSSNVVGSCKKRGYVKKRFRPLISDLPEIMVPTNSRKQTDQLVLVEIRLAKNPDIRKKDRAMILSGSVVEYLGDADSTSSHEIMKRITTGHWRRKIDRSYESSISSTDLMEADRIEYLDALTISVDPENCQDVDDAISIRKNNDRYEIGIHIADPTSYIVENSELDLEGLNRSESVYLEKTNHMYPLALTKDVFSLSSDRESRAFSVIFDVDCETLKISNLRIQKTMIRVNSNETYDEFDQTYRDSELKSTLYKVGHAIYSDMVCTADDSINSYDSKKMIQGLMVYANSVVASRLVEYAKTESNSRVVLRSQPRVDNDSNFDGVPEEIVETHLRLKWKSAILKVWSDDDSDSHFGVGLRLYTHFTSPIRRYSDILIHRLLWNALKNEKFFELTVLNDDTYLQTLFSLNHNKRFYRQMVNFERDWTIYDRVRSMIDSETPIRFVGTIVGIGLTNIRVQISKVVDQTLNSNNDEISHLFTGMIERVDVMSRKMLESFEASDSMPLTYEYDDSGEIISIRYGGDESYHLFDSVEISMVFVKGVRRYRPYL
jgi:exoribonuclease R